MDLFTGMMSQLLTEVGPYLKWANKNWPLVVVCLVGLLLVMHRKNRKS
jgi:hypothetical protein